MKKISYLILIFVLFLIVGCSKHLKFEVPDDNIEIVKNPDDCFNEGIKYEPFIISDEKEKETLISNLNSWKLVVDNRIQDDSCLLYEITWENQHLWISGNPEITGVGFDGESYDIVDGNVDFLDDYEFEQVE